MTREGAWASAAGLAVVLAVGLPHVPGYEKSACLRPELHMGSVLALIVGGGTGFAALVELAAAVAGRGRASLPWRGGFEAARWAAAALLTAAMAYGLAEKSRTAHLFELGALLAGTGALVLAAAYAVGRRGGASVAVALVVLGMLEHSVFGWGELRWPAFWTIIVPIATVLLALRRLGLGREALAARGFRAPAPGDIALIPSAVTLSIASYAHWLDKSGGAEGEVARAFVRIFDKWGGFYWFWALPAAATIWALRYVARRGGGGAGGRA